MRDLVDKFSPRNDDPCSLFGQVFLFDFSKVDQPSAIDT